MSSPKPSTPLNWSEDIVLNLQSLYLMVDSDDFPVLAISLLLKYSKHLQPEKVDEIKKMIKEMQENKDKMPLTGTPTPGSPKLVRFREIVKERLIFMENGYCSS